uniref:NADH-ubiquinone oxidoreductase chain 4 n=1 Tax=Lepidonotus sp. YZ-2018 TaxID=2153334 RepID=A0A343W6C6_9ANNE|nr:NADH dehydrogenase subunit 4 [Lepidonotus sp. YZ-2018]
MLNIILPSLFLLFLPILSPYFWSLSTLSLLFLTFLSILSMFSPDLSFSCLNSLFLLDQMSSSLISLTLWVSALMFMASTSVFLNNNNTKRFSFLVSLLSLILVFSFSASSFINFYIMFESSLIPTLLLVLGWGYQPERLQAGMYLMLYTICASLPLLMSLLIMKSYNGHLAIFLHSSMYSTLHSPLINSIWWMLTILAFMVKMPLYITHLWLPKAHVEAPIAGSMILAGILLKLGGYGLIRLSTLYPNLMFKTSPLWNSIALWGAFITSMICLRQTDIKSLIAYSSVGHMALVILGISLTSNWGWQGALVMMIAHGLCSSCLFALANMTYESSHTRSMFLTKGFLALSPSLALWWFILSICNMAAPPSINLFGEISLIISAIWASPWFMLPIGLCSFLAAAYSLFLFTSINHGAPPKFLNPMLASSYHFQSISLLHAAPIFLLISSPTLISLWF